MAFRLSPEKNLQESKLMQCVLDERGISKNLSQLNLSELDIDITQNEGLDGFELRSIDKYYTPKVVCGSEMPDFTSREIKEIDSHCEKLARILVLYTGGTIGMRTKNGAYEPEPNYLSKALRKMPMFNDRPKRSKMLKILADCSRRGSPLLTDIFLMPRSSDNVRVLFNVWEYNPLLDSSDMTMDDYIRIAQDVKKEYDRYDGFVILHGTDTMAYTGSALSFLFENLAKPVILTGSQIPIFELRSDGRENLLGSLILASHYRIPEVVIYFHEKLFRANRATKTSSIHFDAFDCPNYPPLVESGISITVHEHLLLTKEFRDGPFTVINKLCPDVSVLRMFPSITCATVKAFLSPPVKGIVLMTYGSGNMPYCRKDLLELFKEAYERDVLIVNITQCWRGGVKPIYRTGFILKEYGIYPGLDMTLEAAISKLSYVLSRDDWCIDTKRSALSRNLRGEMTLCQNNTARDKRSLSEDGINLDTECIISAALCTNAKAGNVAMLEQIGRSRGNWEAADYDGRTALHVGASENQLEVVRFLLDKHKNINSKDRFGCTPLKCAVLSRSSKALLSELRIKGAELCMKDEDIIKELVSAIQQNDVVLVDSYLCAGVDVNTTDENGNSLLHTACIYGKINVVQTLLEHGCRTDAFNDVGNSPIDEASIREQNEICDLILNFQNF